MTDLRPWRRGLVVCDYNGTLGPPGITRRLLKDVGANLEAFDRRSRDETAGLEGEERQAARRHVFLGMMVTGALGASVTLADLENRGRQEPLYPNSVGLLAAFRELALRDGGIDLRIAVVSNAPAPVLRATPLSQIVAPDDFVAQEYREVRRNGRSVIQPVGPYASARTKPSSVLDLQRKHSVDPSCVVYLGDGYSDRHVMKTVRDGGGTVIAVFGDDERDIPVQAEVRATGLAHYIVEQDFRFGSPLSEILAGPVLAGIVEHAAERGVPGPRSAVPGAMGRDASIA